MKKYLKYILLCLFSFGFLGCEKDDICAQEDPNTQAVVIEFYNKDERTKTKIPPGLLAYVTGYDIAIKANGNVLTLPLLINANTTSWNLVLNGDDSIEGNEIIDVLTFNYEVEQQYVSKACGYKANFILDETNGVVSTYNWINSIEIINSNIINPNEVHLKIYF
jgi:hypothetical protein